MASGPSGAGAGAEAATDADAAGAEAGGSLAERPPHADASKEARKREGAIRMARTFTRLEAARKSAVPRKSAGRPKLDWVTLYGMGMNGGSPNM